MILFGKTKTGRASICPKAQCTYGGCTCDVMKNYVAMESEKRMIQFLLRLNETFMSIQDQILSSRVFPNINPVFSIVQ